MSGRLLPEQSIQAFSHFCGVVSHCVGIDVSLIRLENEGFDDMIVNMGVLGELAEKMSKQMEEVDWSKVPVDTLDQMSRVVSRLAGYGHDDFDECLQTMKDNMARKKKK
jgi:hypothetical protein